MRNAVAERNSYSELQPQSSSVVSPRAREEEPELPTELPTLRPSGVRLATVPVQELLRRYAAIDGDATATILERTHVPIVVAEGSSLRDFVLDARARWLLPFIDGHSPLLLVLEQSGMPRADAIEAFCALLEHGIVEML
jgi:hypothetical protein